MRRYWIESENLDGDVVVLRDETLHHIRDVCRQTVGDRFEVLLDSQAYLVEIVGESKKESRAKVLSVRDVPPLPAPRIRLVLAIPRFNVFEAVLEKMVEMGVESIQPLFTENSFIRTAAGTWAGKEARFKKIVQGATQQCGRGELLTVLEPMTLPVFLANRKPGAKGLFAYEGQGATPVKTLLAEWRTSEIDAVDLFIGGEGGFSAAEVELFRQNGLPPVTLGAQVLRVETACVALTSILKYECGLMA